MLATVIGEIVTVRGRLKIVDIVALVKKKLLTLLQ